MVIEVVKRTPIKKSIFTETSSKKRLRKLTAKQFMESIGSSDAGEDGESACHCHEEDDNDTNDDSHKD